MFITKFIRRWFLLKTIYGNGYLKDNGYYAITGGKYRGKYLHRLIYEKNYGKIPKGYIIHHKDGNKLNNCIMNLELIKFTSHNSLHHKNKIVSDETKNKQSIVKKGKINPILKIKKYKNRWVCQPLNKTKKMWISSVDLDKCIIKVLNFINSELNDLGYTNYEIIELK